MIFKRCPQCGRIVSKSCTTCDYCGYFFDDTKEEPVLNETSKDFVIFRRKNNIKKRCPQCGRILSQSVEICNNCGYQFPKVQVEEEVIIQDITPDGRKYSIKKRCPKCGRICSESAEKCSNCGYPFVEHPEVDEDIVVEEIKEIPPEPVEEEETIIVEEREPLAPDGRKFSIKKRCPKCGRIVAQSCKECPNCGYLFEPRAKAEVVVEEPIPTPIEEPIPIEEVTPIITPVEPVEEEPAVPEEINNKHPFDIVYGVILRKYRGNQEEVKVPNYVIAIEKNAFANNETLKKITFEGELQFIEEDAFKNCLNLETIEFKNINKLEIHVDAFRCEEDEIPHGVKSVLYDVRKTVVVKNDDFWTEQTPFNSILFKDTTKFKFGDNVENIPPCFLTRLAKVKKLFIPKSVKYIGPCAFRYPFAKNGINNIELESATGWKVLTTDGPVGNIKVNDVTDAKATASLFNDVYYYQKTMLDEENFVASYCYFERK